MLKYYLRQSGLYQNYVPLLLSNWCSQKILTDTIGFDLLAALQFSSNLKWKVEMRNMSFNQSKCRGYH